MCFSQKKFRKIPHPHQAPYPSSFNPLLLRQLVKKFDKQILGDFEGFFQSYPQEQIFGFKVKGIK